LYEGAHANSPESESSVAPAGISFAEYVIVDGPSGSIAEIVKASGSFSSISLFPVATKTGSLSTFRTVIVIVSESLIPFELAMNSML
jgi:hypothetical protein